MNLVKRTGIALLILVFFMSMWMTYQLFEQSETPEINPTIAVDTVVKNLDTIETSKNEQQLSVAESEFLQDSTFLKHAGDGE
ncbi:MAG: hypothetical protein ACKO0Y_09245, partial [Bacteroidota bacterium]